MLSAVGAVQEPHGREKPKDRKRLLQWALREAAKLRHLTAGGGREEVGIQLLGAMRYGLPVVVRQRLMLRV